MMKLSPTLFEKIKKLALKACWENFGESYEIRVFELTVDKQRDYFHRYAVQIGDRRSHMELDMEIDENGAVVYSGAEALRLLTIFGEEK